MREILFRAKRIDNGEWVEGWYQPPVEVTHCDGRKESLGASLSVIGQDGFLEDVYIIPETLGQFTGLTDKNGKRIFEGDIIPVWEQGEEYPYKVVYCGDCFMLSMLDSEQGSYPLSVKCNASEVIGNIHDNPELLEGTDNTVTTEGSI